MPKLFPRALTSLVIVAALSGCGNIPQRTVESKIAEQLPTVIGPADDYNVHVTGYGDAIMRGHVRELTVHGDNVHMTPYVYVDTLDIDAHDISVSPRSKEIDSVGPISFVVTFGQGTVDHYLDKTADEDINRPQKLKVTLRQKDISVHFLESILSQRIPVTVVGKLALHRSDPNKLDFVPSRGSISFMKVPEKAVRYALSRVNPVIDLTQTQIPITVTSVSILDDEVTVTGTVDMTVDQMNKAIERARG